MGEGGAGMGDALVFFAALGDAMYVQLDDDDVRAQLDGQQPELRLEFLYRGACTFTFAVRRADLQRTAVPLRIQLLDAERHIVHQLTLSVWFANPKDSLLRVLHTLSVRGFEGDFGNLEALVARRRQSSSSGADWWSAGAAGGLQSDQVSPAGGNSEE